MQISIIHTACLRLEPFAEGHLCEKLVAWLNDPEVVRYSDQRHRQHTLATSRAYWESFAGSANVYWAVIAVGNPETMIGTVTAYVDDNNLVADVGILLGEKRCWRGGYGTEAFGAVVNWLVRHRKIRKVTAGTMAENTAMLGVMRKAGMREEGRRERYYLFEGREVDMVYGTVFAEEWGNCPDGMTR